MKVLTFSRFFPKTHPKAGKPTFFVEKIWSGLADKGALMDNFDFNGLDLDFSTYYFLRPKWHTVRAGDRWKVGDWFSPRVWSGKPYNSPQIVFGPDIQIEKIFKFELLITGACFVNSVFVDNFYKVPKDASRAFNNLAMNDGLSVDDFKNWFAPKRAVKPFVGQVICWNSGINY